MSTEFYNRNFRMPNSWNGSTDNNSKVSNYSMSFDGSSEFIDCGTDIGNYFGENYTGEMAISIWFKADVTSSDDGIFQFTGSTSLGEISAAIYANDLEFRIKGSTEVSGSFTDTSNWHNLIINLFGPSGANQLYLDGVAFGSTFTYSSGGLDLNGETFNIGHYGSSRYFSGKLDHCCIFDYALSAQQISDLQGSSSTGVGNPMSLSPKPKFYYPIGDYAAFNGSEYLVPNGALSDYVFDFDGTNDYINCGSIDETEGITTMSISGWFNPQTNGVAGAAGIIAKESRDFYVGWYSSPVNSIRFLISSNDGTTKDALNSLTLGTNANVLNKWHHFVCSWDASDKLKIYINGVLSSETNSVNATSALPTSTNIVEIGRRVSTYFDGQISNVSIWNAALTSTQITELYNQGKPSNLNNHSAYSNLVSWWKLDASATFDGSNWSIPDDSSNSNTGTSNGMTASNLVQSNLNITTPYSRYALSFDGTGDKIELPYNAKLNSGADGYTISSWVNISSTSGNKAIYSTEYDEGMVILIAGDDIKFYQALTGPNWKFFTVNSSYALSLNTWYNIIATWDGSNNVKIYLNGSLIHTESGFTSLQNPTSPSQFPKIGDYNNQWSMNGFISNVSMWNSSLNQTQITEIYNQGKPSNLNNHSAYSNLVSWWQLGENMSYDGTKWIVLDEKGSNNGEGTNLGPAEDSIVNGVGTSGNGLSDGMGGADNIIGDAPYSTANAVSYGMGVDAKSTSVPS